MKPLNLEKALQLYTLIGKYLPENVDENSDVLDFVGTIVKNIKNSGNHIDYINAVVLMTGFDEQVILQSEPDEILSTFIQCLIDNRILDLKEFAESVSNG